MQQQNVNLFVFDSLSDWEIGYAAAGINNPLFQAYPGRYRIQTVGLRRDPVVTMGGIRIIPDGTLDEIDMGRCAMLILSGGVSWNEGKNMEAVEIAGEFLKRGIPVAGICGATAGLARGGLLDRRRHTSNARDYLVATRYQGQAFYEEAPAVTDQDAITASGIAPVDFACHIFRRLEIFAPAVLEAWYNLFKTGRPEYYADLMRSVNAPE